MFFFFPNLQPLFFPPRSTPGANVQPPFSSFFLPASKKKSGRRYLPSPFLRLPAFFPPFPSLRRRAVFFFPSPLLLVEEEFFFFFSLSVGPSPSPSADCEEIGGFFFSPPPPLSKNGVVEYRSVPFFPGFLSFLCEFFFSFFSPAI